MKCETQPLTPSSALPNSVRHIITYLKVRHLVDCVDNVTFRDLVLGTGLSPRTVRKALSILKSLNLIKVSRDFKHGRRHLYQLNFKKLCEIFPEDKLVSDGLYFIDVGIGLRKFLSPKAIAVISCADVVLYTENVPSQVLELVPEKATTFLLDRQIPLSNLAKTGVVVVLFDGVLDREKIANMLSQSGVGTKVSCISCTSPITYAAQLLECGRCCKVLFKRSPVQIELYVRKGTSYISGEVVKCVKVMLEMGNGHYELKALDTSVDELRNVRTGEDVAYVVYVRR